MEEARGGSGDTEKKGWIEGGEGIPGGTLQRARQHGNVVKIKSN